MSDKIEIPLSGVRIDMVWNTYLYLPPDKMATLVSILNEGTLISEEYNKDPVAVAWGEDKKTSGNNVVTFSHLTPEMVAEAKMNQLNDP